jgi:hypothetical protein
LRELADELGFWQMTMDCQTGDVVGAERGWIGDPQPPVEWRDSHYSRTLQKLTEEIQADQEAKNVELRGIDCSHIPPLRIAARYAAGRPGARRRGETSRATEKDSALDAVKTRKQNRR